jgi:hypothetical protein
MLVVKKGYGLSTRLGHVERLEKAGQGWLDDVDERSCLALRILLDHHNRQVQALCRVATLEVRANYQVSAVWNEGDTLLSDRSLDSLGERCNNSRCSGIDCSRSSLLVVIVVTFVILTAVV